jgi:hypothetical protein
VVERGLAFPSVARLQMHQLWGPPSGWFDDGVIINALLTVAPFEPTLNRVAYKPPLDLAFMSSDLKSGRITR